MIAWPSQAELEFLVRAPPHRRLPLVVLARDAPVTPLLHEWWPWSGMAGLVLLAASAWWAMFGRK